MIKLKLIAYLRIHILDNTLHRLNENELVHRDTDTHFHSYYETIWVESNIETNGLTATLSVWKWMIFAVGLRFDTMLFLKRPKLGLKRKPQYKYIKIGKSDIAFSWYLSNNYAGNTSQFADVKKSTSNYLPPDLPSFSSLGSYIRSFEHLYCSESPYFFPDILK